ncbi:hypothetical protein IQ255_30825 [Pleurocapsales cyanobacterium LEGE 10410]|nr:hypothetical protein [Pleurocapsales cyanobacterium LEGE 10410]
MNNADDIDSLVSQLSAKEKAELVQKLLGQSGLMVVMGGSNVTTSDVVIQIHSTSDIDVSELLRAVATRITQPKNPTINGKPKNVQGEDNQQN